MRHTEGFVLKGRWLFLAIINMIQLARALSTSSSTDCSTERQGCLADPACLQCEQLAVLGGGGDFNPPWPDDFLCHQAYPDAFSYKGSEGFQSIACENRGALHCCTMFGDVDSAQNCMSNDAATAFWDCLMGGDLDGGCSVYDMPCHPESSVICKADLLVCEDDPVCSSCLSSQSASFSGDCSSRYPDVFERSGYEGGFAGSFCEVTGAEICCEFEDIASAESCLANPAMASYQACVMDETDCLPDDIPCINAGLVPTSSDGSSPTSSSTGTSSTTPTDDNSAPSAFRSSDASTSSTPSPLSSNVESPTTLYATSSSVTTTPAASPSSNVESPTTLYAPSSTPSPTTSSTCADLAAACQSDAVCEPCLAALSDTSWNDCRDRYPDLYEPLGGENGLSGSFCELAGAEICCQYEDKVSAASCLENDAMAAYHECQMADEGCLLDDMPCDGDVVTTTPAMASDPTTPAPVDGITPAPSTSVASSSSAEGARGFDLTPSPSANDIPETVDFSNGATVVMRDCSSVIMLLWASFLVAASTVLAG